jgi:di/tricarboxylate transporter
VTGPAIWAWLALAATLAAVAGGYRRFEVVAFGSLVVLGAVGAAGPGPATGAGAWASPGRLFAGFGHPALVTIASLFVVGAALSESGVLAGLGRRLERRWQSTAGQIAGLAAVAGGLSAFMSNVAALSLVLPTAKRMAGRGGVPAGRFGLPLAFAAMLGGTLTLAGSAPNIIVSGYRSTALGGGPFRMFDFLPHGAAACAAAALVWWLAELPKPGAAGRGHRSNQAHPDPAASQANPDSAASEPPAPEFLPLGTPRRRLCLALLAGAVLAVSLGLLPPSVGFGLAAVAMVVLGVIDASAALGAIDPKVIVFLGSMLSLGEALAATGGLDAIAGWLEPLVASLSRWWLLAAVFAASTVLSNILNNAAAAVVMAPVAARLAVTSSAAGPDAMLMAVAAGSCLALILPTHQVTLVALSQAPFSVGRMRAAGLVVTAVAGVAAVSAIAWFWP